MFLLKKNVLGHSLQFFSFAVLVIFLVSCSSTKETEPQTAELVFKKAMEKFNSGDYIESNSLLDVIKLQYPASSYADDAQYYIAEINFKRGEFILAAFNYNMLRRVYPTSEYNKTSMYKAALCYYELSPSFDRDQEYTIKAIDALQDYQRQYPNDSLYKLASANIDELREKLGHRSYSIAELYSTMLSPASSLVYLDDVIENYPDTKYFEPAFFMKINLMIGLKRYDEANAAIDNYKRLFPVGLHIDDINTKQKLISGLK